MAARAQLHICLGTMAYGNPNEPPEEGSGPIKAIFLARDEAEEYVREEYAETNAKAPDDLVASGDIFLLDLPGGRVWAVADI